MKPPVSKMSGMTFKGTVSRGFIPSYFHQTSALLLRFDPEEWLISILKIKFGTETQKIYSLSDAGMMRKKV
jgi:hypothetical protein